MDLRNMTAARAVRRAVKVFFIIMGDSGTGKTRLGAIMSQHPLIALFERQGEATIMQNNPDAVIWMLYEDDECGTYTGTPFGQITNPALKLTKLGHILEAIWMSETHESGEGRLVPTPVVSTDGKHDIVGWDWDCAIHVESFCIDTLTEFQICTFNLLLGREAYDPALVDFKDKSLGAAYQNLNRRTQILCEQLRDLPVHAMALGHVGEKEARGGTKAMLALSGDKVSVDLPRMATACGWMIARETEGKIARFCVFQGASDVAILKWCAGLEAIEPLPDDPGEAGPEDWIHRILEAGPSSIGGLKGADVNEGTGLGHVAKIAADSQALAAARKERAARRKGRGGFADGAGSATDGDSGTIADGGQVPARGRIKRSDLKGGE